MYPGPDTSAAPAAPAAKARILVVEDEPHLSDLLVVVLREEGYAAEAAVDGAAAVAAIRRQQPDLILLDLMLPGYSGWDFINLYRQTPPPHAPVLVITAAPDSTLLGIQSGVEAVIRKPFSIDEVLALVRSHTNTSP